MFYYALWMYFSCTGKAVDSGEEGSFTETPQEGEWSDENPALLEDNCELAYEDPSNPESIPIFIDISHVQDGHFVFMLPWENDVSWQEDEIAPTTDCTWDQTGRISCLENVYMQQPLSEYFEGEPSMQDELSGISLEGTMLGTLSVSGVFIDAQTLEGNMKNVFDCQGESCQELGQTGSCIIHKSFVATFDRITTE